MDSLSPDIPAYPDYGSILNVYKMDDRVILAVVWKYFNPRGQDTVEYGFVGANISLEISRHPHDEGGNAAPATDDR